MSAPHDRAAAEPGGMECMECGVIFVGAEWHTCCAVCAEKPRPIRAGEGVDMRKKTIGTIMAVCGGLLFLALGSAGVVWFVTGAIRLVQQGNYSVVYVCAFLAGIVLLLVGGNLAGWSERED